MGQTPTYHKHVFYPAAGVGGELGCMEYARASCVMLKYSQLKYSSGLFSYAKQRESQNGFLLNGMHAQANPLPPRPPPESKPLESNGSHSRAFFWPVGAND